MTDQTVVQRVGTGITKLRNFVMNTIFLVVMVAVIVLVVGSLSDEPVPENSALVLNPRGAMVEQRSINDPFDDLWLIGQNLPEANIHELVRAVEHAATDDRIEMIVLDLDELSWSSNTHATYLGTALNGFKATGKQVIAFGNYYSQAQYSIATFADAIYLHPFGQLMLSGFGAYQLYFKNLFDRFDVNVHVFRVGEYKAAVEPFTRSDMSPAAKEANQQLVGGLWQIYADLVVENRDIESEAFDYYTHAFDDALTAAGGDMARAALEYHLVDELLIGFFGGRRHIVAGKRLYGLLVLAHAEHVDVDVEPVEKVLEVQLVGAKARKHELAERMQVNRVGKGRDTVLSLAVVITERNHLFASGFEAIECGAEISGMGIGRP